MNDTGTAPAPVTLLIGPEDFIAERTVQQIRRAARAVDPQTEMVEQSAAEVGVGELTGLLAPSLFSAARVLVIEQAADATPELGAELLAYAADPPLIDVDHLGAEKLTDKYQGLPPQLVQLRHSAA